MSGAWSWFGRPLFFRAPCRERDLARRDRRLAPLVDLIGQDGLLRADAAQARLVEHVRGCDLCEAELTLLRRQRETLAGLGDVEGAAPTDAGFRRVMAALAEERAVRQPRPWLPLAAGTAALLIAVVVGFRQRQASLARLATDEAIVSGAQAAFRRAEHEYGAAVALLRDRLRVQYGGVVDAKVEEGARVLAEARERAAKLAAEHRADPEREALLRDALRAEVRYYEDALLRATATEVPQP